MASEKENYLNDTAAGATEQCSADMVMTANECRLKGKMISSCEDTDRESSTSPYDLQESMSECKRDDGNLSETSTNDSSSCGDSVSVASTYSAPSLPSNQHYKQQQRNSNNASITRSNSNNSSGVGGGGGGLKKSRSAQNFTNGSGTYAQNANGTVPYFSSNNSSNNRYSNPGRAGGINNKGFYQRRHYQGQGSSYPSQEDKPYQSYPVPQSIAYRSFPSLDVPKSKLSERPLEPRENKENPFSFEISHFDLKVQEQTAGALTPAL